jgi:hypothetical protein
MFWRWRKATWALVIFDVLMLLWVISTAQATSTNCTGKVGDALAACRVGTGIGAGIGFTLILILWFMGFIVLSLIWMMSRPRKRLCPQCGRDVKRGLIQCPSCGYQFGQGPQAAIDA